MRTSYSAIDTYLTCPQKYKFQEIDRIRAPKSREALFGSLIHACLNFMFKSDPLFPTLDEVINFYRAHWPSHETFLAETKNDPLKHAWNEEDEKAYFDEGVRMLKRFYEKNAPWTASVVDLESRFEISIQDEKTGKTHILAGIVDRIDKLPDNTYEIVDYKTARRMPSQKDINDNLQLSLYSIGLHTRWPHIPLESIKLSLYFLKHGEKISAKASPEKAESTKIELLKTVSEIDERREQSKEFEPMPSVLCNWCAFRPVCPAWKHLYKTQNSNVKTQSEIEGAIKEYFHIKESEKVNKNRLDELQEQIRTYMDAEGLTRVFSKAGTISKKTTPRYEYDFEKVKTILSPLGKWEDILKADETRLKKIMGEIPEDARRAVEDARRVLRETVSLFASTKKIAGPEDEGNGDSPAE